VRLVALCACKLARLCPRVKSMPLLLHVRCCNASRAGAAHGSSLLDDILHRFFQGPAHRTSARACHAPSGAAGEDAGHTSHRMGVHRLFAPVVRDCARKVEG